MPERNHEDATVEVDEYGERWYVWPDDFRCQRVSIEPPAVSASRRKPRVAKGVDVDMNDPWWRGLFTPEKL